MTAYGVIRRLHTVPLWEVNLFVGLKGDTFRITGAAAGLTGANLDVAGGALVTFGVISTLLYTAHNTLNCVVCFHFDSIPFLLA